MATGERLAAGKAASVEPPGLLSLDEARTRILAGVVPPGIETVALEEALGRVVAEPVVSRLTLPPWDNSAMDGFAVRAADVDGAAASSPVVLRVVGEAAAGHMASVEVQAGTAIRILTGAPLPAGADAVVPLEDTDARPSSVELPSEVAISVAAPPGAHIRRAGSDLRAGALLLAAGTVLDAAAIAVAAAGGHGSVTVHRRPRVGVLATGDELVPPGTRPGPAQIPDSNSAGLLAQAREAGADARAFGIARDSLRSVVARLEDAVAWADVVVVSGGVSVGAHDVVRDAFERLGRVEIWRVAVQPGKPLAFGRTSGSRGVLLFGLPGNPVSSFVTFELFVRPVLRTMAGRSDAWAREVVPARLTDRLAKAPGRRAFLRVRLEPRPGEDPPHAARLAGGQGSHVLSALAAADGLAVVPENVDAAEAGSVVDVLRIRPAAGA